MAMEILKGMTPGAPDTLVIRSAKDGAQIDLKGPWARIKATAGLATGPEIQAAMGHANIQTSSRYIHFAAARRNELAEKAANVATAGLTASRESNPPKLRIIK
jgi:hypothetical protein